MIGAIAQAHAQRQQALAKRQERFALLAQQYQKKGHRMIYAQDRRGTVWVWVERPTTIPKVTR